VIDFRYHLVSIVAVFLALAIGIVIGTTALNGPVTEALQKGNASLNGDLNNLRDQSAALQQQIAAAETFVQAAAPQLVGHLLDGQRVVVIGMPGSSLRSSLVQVPGSLYIELIEYVKPKGKAVDMSTSNPGIAHIALSVDNIDRMYEDLSKKGVKFVSRPIKAPALVGNGTWAVCYLRGPDGITVELIEKQK